MLSWKEVPRLIKEGTMFKVDCSIAPEKIQRELQEMGIFWKGELGIILEYPERVFLLIDNKVIYYFSNLEEYKESQAVEVLYTEKSDLEEVEGEPVEKVNYDRSERLKEYFKSVGKDPQRKNSGKLRWSLLPLSLLKGVVEVLEMGAEKYTPEGWKDMKTADMACEDSFKRHMIAMEEGEMYDKESGLLHINHMITNLIMMKYHLMKLGFTDKKEEK